MLLFANCSDFPVFYIEIYTASKEEGNRALF